MTSIIKVNTIQDGGGNVLITSNGSGTLTTNNIGGDNTPAFFATLSANQNTTDITTTKIQFNTEVLDTDNCYDNSTNYRFTPTSAGKYFVYASFIGRANSVSNLTNLRTYIYKNGSEVNVAHHDFRNNLGLEATNFMGVVVDLNGSSDYVEYFARVDHAGSGGIRSDSYAGAYKIIGA